MAKIDRRKSYYMVFDTETSNGLDDPIVYDIGFVIVDKKGNVYEAKSFVIYETFCKMKDLMQSAYYADKIPNYIEQIERGERKSFGSQPQRKSCVNCAKSIMSRQLWHTMRDSTTEQPQPLNVT